MPRSIIAMKGPPFTRKTELATLIAKSLSCPVLSLDDVLDVLHPDDFDSKSASDVAFDILCRMASSYLLKGAFANVVLDSPLSSQLQLVLLIKLARSFAILYPQSRLVIVECKPGNNYSWKLRFDGYLQDHTCSYTRKWYKPKNWDDIEKAIRNSFDDINGVSKLVLDPFLDLPNFFDVGRSKHPLFMKAIQYMTTRNKGDGSYTVMYHQWRQSQYITSASSHLHSHPLVRSHRTQSWKEVNGGQQATISSKDRRMESPLLTLDGNASERLCKGGHCISGYSDKGVENESNCIACEEQVMCGGGPAYTCKDCSLMLHKHCAESFDSTSLRLSELPDSQMQSCSSCKEQGKKGSRNCAACLFETNIKARIMPTVIRHGCEKHFLSFVIPPVKNEGYLCAACGDCDMSDSYSCKICNLAYHFECLINVPPRLKHEHGGHHHHMQLNFSTTIVEEDYLCQECQEWRDPQLWYYSCENCPYETHLYCVLPRKERMPPPPRVDDTGYNSAPSACYLLNEIQCNCSIERPEVFWSGFLSVVIKGPGVCWSGFLSVVVSVLNCFFLLSELAERLISQIQGKWILGVSGKGISIDSTVTQVENR